VVLPWRRFTLSFSFLGGLALWHVFANRNGFEPNSTSSSIKALNSGGPGAAGVQIMVLVA
jgi:hypothetical protein